MNILDLIILGLMTFLLIKGIFRGFFREISSLAGIIFGFLVANHYYHGVANLLRSHIPFEKFLPLVSFIILFIVVLIVFNLFGLLLHHVFKRLFIGWFDRSLGIAFALTKGIIVSYLLIVLLIMFVPSTNPLIAKSKTAPLVKLSFESMRSLISPDLYKTWKRRISKESEKVGKVISEGKEVIKSIPEVLPDKKE
jgi:membrane protein required for colicin V production